MEDQDKIFDQLKSVARKAESKEFPAMEKVWSRVEEKLDKKEDKKVIALWKKLAVAASLLLFLSLGYQFFKSDATIPNAKPENSVVTSDTKDSVQATPLNPIVKSEEADLPKENISIRNDAEKILRKQVGSKSVAVSDIDDAKDHLNKKEVVSESVSKAESDKSVSAETFATTNPATGVKTITGIVSDASGTLPGVNVYVIGTQNGTQTDVDGKFTIQAKEGDRLEFTFVGMSDSQATVGASNQINVTLNQGIQLAGIVVQANMGYLKKEKSAVTSSIMIKGENITRSSAKKSSKYRDGDKKTSTQSPGAIEQSLEEKAAGVPLSNSDESDDKANDFNYYRGNPKTKNKIGGSEIYDIKNDIKNATFDTLPNGRILMRGVPSSIADPLYIIDGIPVKAGLMTIINPEEIESINILKQESATTIYGSSGSNGAIIIKTKDGWNKRKIRRMERKLEKAEKAHLQSVIEHKSIPEIEVTEEDYDPFIENPFESPRTAPLSTFSIDVDNASYTNVRRFINNGQSVPKDAVRVEEMVNFFKYDYPQPTNRHPFSINSEYSECPWNAKHKLLRIGLQGKITDTEKLPASNLVFLIDVSGSMSDTNKLPLLIQSMKVLVNELRSKDKVSIVVYAGAAGLVLPPTSGSDKQAIIDALEKLTAGGSTAGGEGIELAYKLAQENFIKGGNNRVVLATDGDFNVGASSNEDMQTLIEEKRKSGVFSTCLGYGMDNYKDSKMEILSDKGNGNYAYIDNIQEANRFLGKEFKGSMFAIAKDVKIQVEFNPYYVQSYRLIGYENRKLNAEDFKNDAIDAGELGSGHTVTALYEVIPVGVTSNFSKDIDELKFTKSEPMSANFNNQLAFIKFRYKKPDGDRSIEMDQYIKNDSVPLPSSSSDFKFSAAVAWFGLKLRDSKLIENKASEDIEKLAKQGLSNDSEGYRAEFIRLVETVK